MEPSEKLRIYDECEAKAKDWSCEELQAKLKALGRDCIVDKNNFDTKVETYAELLIIQKMESICGPLPVEEEGCYTGKDQPGPKPEDCRPNISFVEYYKELQEMFPYIEKIQTIMWKENLLLIYRN
uniref:Uncharacterized protein n=1 Tax=Ditylenchus dipsaci TaxID=166011 RepID=A0A915DCH6_9BILA